MPLVVEAEADEEDVLIKECDELTAWCGRNGVVAFLPWLQSNGITLDQLRLIDTPFLRSAVKDLGSVSALQKGVFLGVVKALQSEAGKCPSVGSHTSTLGSEGSFGISEDENVTRVNDSSLVDSMAALRTTEGGISDERKSVSPLDEVYVKNIPAGFGEWKLRQLFTSSFVVAAVQRKYDDALRRFKAKKKAMEAKGQWTSALRAPQLKLPIEIEYTRYWGKTLSASFRFKEPEHVEAAIDALNNYRFSDEDLAHISVEDRAAKHSMPALFVFRRQKNFRDRNKVYASCIPAGFGEAKLRELFSSEIVADRVQQNFDEEMNEFLCEKKEMETKGESTTAPRAPRLKLPIGIRMIRYFEHSEADAACIWFTEAQHSQAAVEVLDNLFVDEVSHFGDEAKTCERQPMSVSFARTKEEHLQCESTIKSHMALERPLANLFVKNLPPAFNDATLYDAFARFGTILSAKMAYDKRTRAVRDFGYVQYKFDADANRAIRKMNGSMRLGGERPLSVRLFEAKSKRQVKRRKMQAAMREFPQRPPLAQWHSGGGEPVYYPSHLHPTVGRHFEALPPLPPSPRFSPPGFSPRMPPAPRYFDTSAATHFRTSVGHFPAVPPMHGRFAADTVGRHLAVGPSVPRPIVFTVEALSALRPSERKRVMGERMRAEVNKYVAGPRLAADVSQLLLLMDLAQVLKQLENPPLLLQSIRQLVVQLTARK